MGLRGGKAKRVADRIELLGLIGAGAEDRDHHRRACKPLHKRFQKANVSPGVGSTTLMPFASHRRRRTSGVPVSSGKVPKCMGTTVLAPVHSAATAASSGPIV